MKIKDCIALVAIMVSVGVAHTAHAQDAYTTTPLSVSAVNWTTTDDNGDFADTWASGKQKFAFVSVKGSPHFELQFFNFPSNISKGKTVGLQLTFDKASRLGLFRRI